MAEAITISRLLIDEPAHDDRLEYERFLTALDQLVFDDTAQVRTPLTIAVYGSWGSGKSSLLRMLRKRLSPRDNTLWSEDDRKKPTSEWLRAEALSQQFVAAEFSPWTHRKESNLLVPLLLTLKEQLKPHEEMMAEITKIAAITGWHIGRTVLLPLGKKMATAAVKVATAGLINVEQEADNVLDVEQIEKSAKQVEGEFERDQPKLDLSDFAKVRELVETFVNKVRKKGKTDRKLVLLIDDLDRCHPPEQIIELLEQIKLFLSIEGCIFILACDRDVVVKAIEGRFPGEGAAYLDKFVQLPIHLPTPQAPQIARLIEEVDPTTDPDAGTWHGYLQHIAAAYGNNPRRFKRFWNNFRLAERVLLDQTFDFSMSRSSSNELGSAGPPKYDRYLLAKWIVIRDASSRFGEQPPLWLSLERGNQLLNKKDSETVRAHLGIDPAVWLFLRLDADRKFETIQRLSIYSRLTGRDLDISRTDIERRALLGQKMPVDLTGIDFRHAILRNADFAGCDLSLCNFSHAILDGSNFDGANLLKVDFSFTMIDGTSWRQIQNADFLIARDPETVRRILNLTLAAELAGNHFQDFPTDRQGQSNYIPSTPPREMAAACNGIDQKWFDQVIEGFRNLQSVTHFDYWRNISNLVALQRTFAARGSIAKE